MSELDSMNGIDPVYRFFLQRQLELGTELAAASDLLNLHIAPLAPPHVIAEFRCKGMVREPDGEIHEASEFHVGIWFPPDYLKGYANTFQRNTFQMLRMYTPGVWHPNVSAEAPFICIGRLASGTTLVDILYQIFDILTYNKFNPREDDALNKAACAWARAHQDRFPIDRRPLKRRSLSLEVLSYAAR